MNLNLFKEGFDTLPTAVCFFDSRGIVRLVNEKMIEIGNLFLDNNIQTLEEFKDALEVPRFGIKKIERDFPLYELPDGKFIRFHISEIETESHTFYTEISAIDVTELMYRQKQLQEENKYLQETNDKLNELMKQLPEIIKEEEVLSMKMRVHDDIGHSILSARKSLLQLENIEEIRKNAAIWEESIALLYHAGKVKDSYEIIEKKAEAIGIKLILNGKLKDVSKHEAEMLLAIQECITNCVKHAKGDEIYITYRNEEDSTILEITNNGIVPKGKIVEGGGLTSLRQKIERSGGVMIVESSPRFMLRVEFQKEKTNEKCNDC